MPHNDPGFQHPLDNTNHASGLGFLTIDSLRLLVTIWKYINHFFLDSHLLRTSGDPGTILDSTFLHITPLQYHHHSIPQHTSTPPQPSQQLPIQSSPSFSPHYTMVQPSPISKSTGTSTTHSTSTPPYTTFHDLD